MADDRISFVKQVKEANDIVAVIGSYLSLTQAGKVFRGLCPFHADSKPSLQVDSQWQNYKCWACGAKGDVITFIEKFEKIEFKTAVELLARRANIATASASPQDIAKARMYEALKWAAELFHQCLLDDPLAESARVYLGGRKLSGETVRRWQLGFAPNAFDWLLRQAKHSPVPLETLIEVGLIGVNDKGSSRYYDRFRERVMFPIRDVQGRVVGFGGRILPESPYADRIAKYLNTSDTELFKKSELIYGLDIARLAGQAQGTLAVVEGYTDVLMAHQVGVGNVVATMGTALTDAHVKQLRRYAPKVTLVYDADAGGTTGVDRALQLFVREDVDLGIATLPDGLDPFDLLVTQGVEPFRIALDAAKNALDFKIDQLLATADGNLEANRRAADAVLGMLALVPESAGAAAAMKVDLVLHRLSHRLGLRLATLQARLAEARRAARAKAPKSDESIAVSLPSTGSGRAEPFERELVEVLLADPGLVGVAKEQIATTEVRHPGLRRLIQGLYDLFDEGAVPDLDGLRLRLADNPALADFAMRFLEVGRLHPDKPAWLREVARRFRERREHEATRSLQSKLSAASDHEAAMELLRKLQQSKALSPNGLSAGGG